MMGTGERVVDFRDITEAKLAAAEREAEEAIEQIAADAMPPMHYRLAHPEARLSRTERRILMEALEQMAEDSDDDHDRGHD